MYRGTNGCMYNCGDSCTGECMKPMDESIDKKELDAVSEISRILQEEMDRIWDEASIGYNEDNDGYHMGKGLIVNKETWDKYIEATKTEPELDAYEFMVRLLKEEAKKLKDEQLR